MKEVRDCGSGDGNDGALVACDERGTNEYNLALGERRARAAYEFLVLMGISSSRLSIISYGEEYPAVQGGNEAAWAKNRRDEFKASAN